MLGTWEFSDELRARALAMEQQVAALQVDDPVLDLVRADILTYSQRLDDAATLYDQARNGLDGNDDPFLAFRLQRSLIDFYARQGDQAAIGAARTRAVELFADMARSFGPGKGRERLMIQIANRLIGSLVPLMREQMVGAASDPAFSGHDARFYLNEIYLADQLTAKDSNWMNGEMVARIEEQEGVDPWLRDVIVGIHCARTAQHAGATDTQRIELLRVAANRLLAAHERNSRAPHAAAVMTRLAFLLPEDDLGAPREWFERTISQVIDFQSAYTAFADSLRPRNGGSIQALYRFGIECLDSGRFELEIPVWLGQCLSRIQHELPEPREAWEAVGVAQAMDLTPTSSNSTWNGWRPAGTSRPEPLQPRRLSSAAGDGAHPQRRLVSPPGLPSQAERDRLVAREP